MSRARVFPRQVRNALTRTGGYLSGYTHSLQPYVGCEFSCTYCYVRALPVQRANPYGLAWSEWISPKRNLPTLLERTGARGGLTQARIFCSSSTDPYTPLERTERITRACLDIFARHPPAALVLQTRSPRVIDDIARIARIETAAVSFTITTDDERVRRVFEPDSPRFARRLEVLERLRAAGVRSQAALAPLLPCDPERFARALDPLVDRVVIDDFWRGDGAGGSRSRPAIARLRELGFGSWLDPLATDAALETFRRVLGPERVVFSEAGFNDVSGLLGAENATPG